MLRCLDGLKNLCVGVVNWCYSKVSGSKPPPSGLENPEEISRITVCMLWSLPYYFPFYDIKNFGGMQIAVLSIADSGNSVSFKFCYMQ